MKRSLTAIALLTAITLTGCSAQSASPTENTATSPATAETKPTLEEALSNLGIQPTDLSMQEIAYNATKDYCETDEIKLGMNIRIGGYPNVETAEVVRTVVEYQCPSNMSAAEKALETAK